MRGSNKGIGDVVEKRISEIETVSLSSMIDSTLLTNWRELKKKILIYEYLLKGKKGYLGNDDNIPQQKTN